MTWLEFKQQAEALGVRDDDHIGWIDVEGFGGVHKVDRSDETWVEIS
jgi:hypothetical protein